MVKVNVIESYKEYGKLSSKLYTYSREDDKQKILVVCSFTDKTVSWSAPAGFALETGELILGNYPNSNPAALQPYETRVYRWMK